MCIQLRAMTLAETQRIIDHFSSRHAGAFKVAPNRTLQRFGFKYVKTYVTVPGPLNFHQAVNRWAIERQRELPGGSVPIV